MANINFSQKQEVVFPENTPLVLAELLEKYGFKETPQEVSEKIEKGKEPLVTMFAKIVRRAGEEKMTVNTIANLLREKLNMPSRKAQQLARDIKTEILDMLEKPESKTYSQETEKSQKKERFQKRDIYREPIE
jgi:hypothetical protein